MRILITGATGLIGRELGKSLAEKGHEIFVVSRSLAKAREMLPFPCEVIIGDLSKGPIKNSYLDSVDAVINLMGEPVFGSRWTEEKKKNIYNSRVLGTRNLVDSIPESVKIFISSSAIGYYGSCADEVIFEDHGAGEDFLAKVCIDWEKETLKAPGRKIIMRTGIVLSQSGGALDQMFFPFRAGVGGPLATGRQWMSWIHLKDIVGLYLFALENQKVQGPINGVGPEPVTNKIFSEILAQALGKKTSLPVPFLILKMLYGEASEVLVSSIRGSSSKVENLGYNFNYKELYVALKEICSSFKEGKEIFYSEQFLPEPPEKVFSFFKEAQNLEKITPPTLQFKIEKISSKEIQQGTEIDYKIKIHGVPAKWKTEIDEWQPPYKFVDNQKVGPYREWHHTHEFKPFCGGTLLIDKVQYRLPLGYLGWLVGNNFIHKDVENIFSFRRKYISTMDVPKKG